MKDETYKQLLKIADEKGYFATSLIWDYFMVESLGMQNEKGIVNLVVNKHNPLMS